MTLTEANQHLQAWLAADLALAEGQELRIGSRTLTRSNAAEVKERVAYWQREVNRLSGQSRRFRRVVPID
jgi:uncharacterized small protein (DUF1192 family)